ncbi:FAD-dependent oxidoreductase [Rhodoplanes sp. TEM]|uniref:FAD-dependent oxidoreductase n=1 Tax=Rhodoplanes tepidamans TaxID=200616 RepID=A0ABT5J8D0_RHOTP|nr:MULTISPECIES: FAD-dependent oxidoreductase [Rhodoplanes]MDC7785908.1 FAD-dependent oxidoreductase [Rhodoplanes tepidamans]MDC7985020.1 FAD-dependent oxidoreductase [Rhodoplanes sp. TEM]MDQ0355474.1 selenide,water dikinase [Rhodoplanes tepidamans]
MPEPDAREPLDLVLVGGGHAHVQVLGAFAARPEPGVRLTLVTRDLATPYSGMVPGVVAGRYTAAEAHVALAPLAARAGARLVHDSAVGLDRAARRVRLAAGPPLPYGLVSLDVGICPDLAAIDGAATHAIAVKPIGRLLEKVEALRERCRGPGRPRRIVVVGGGAGGVELMLALRARLVADAAEDGRDPGRLGFALVTAGTLLATHNARVQAALRRALAAHGVVLYEHWSVAAVRQDAIVADTGDRIPADAVLVTTHAAAPRWLADTGLALDSGGFVAVGPTLQSVGDPDVFAAGDCAALMETPREKAGVYAVRAGPPLAANLRARARGEPLRPWRPQRRHLALIATGDGRAVASRGAFAAEGAWLWRLKDWIDRRWMRRWPR